LFIYLGKKKYSEEIRILSFFFFLMFSVMYTLFFCRLVTNSFIYGMTEFRYQYLQNALIILIAGFLIDRFIRFSLKLKMVFVSLVTAVFMINLYCAHQEIRINNEQFADLATMLSNINNGMRQGYINQQHKLYLEDNLPDYLPSLCWNIEVGDKFIRSGTYQWMFSAKQIKYFAKDLDEASWVIDKDDFKVIPKEKMHLPARKRVSLGKEEQYLNLANYYRKHKNFARAEEILQSGLKVNPENYKFYYYLRDCYLDQGLAEKAEIANHKAEAMYDDYCLRLAEDYRQHKRFKQAEAALRANIKDNPDGYRFYYALRDCYLDQGLAEKAEIANRKAEEIQSNQSAK
jgi:tetratricopeptide (TPR) repeat protein